MHRICRSHRRRCAGRFIHILIYYYKHNALYKNIGKQKQARYPNHSLPHQLTPFNVFKDTQNYP